MGGTVRQLTGWLCCLALLGGGVAVAQEDDTGGAGDGGAATDGGEDTGEDTGDDGDADDLTGTEPVNTDPRPTLPVQRNELNRNQLGEDLSLPPAGSSLGTGIRLRPWLVFQPSYRLAVFYDDNIFRQGFSSREEDIEITNTLTGRIAATRDRWDAAISYSAIFRNFVDNDNADSVDHQVNTSAGLRFNRVTFRLGGGLSLNSRPTDPQFGGDQQRRMTAQGSLTTTVTITQRIGLQIESQVNRIDFRDRAFDFFDQLGYGVQGYVSFDPNIPVTFLAGGGYRELLYTNDDDAIAPDISFVSVLAGVSVATADDQFTFDLRGGYEIGDIIKRRTFDPNRNAPEGIFVSAAGGWVPNQLTSFTLTLTRQITFSAQADTLTLTRIDFAVTRALPLNTSAFFRVGWGLQDNRDGPARRSTDVTLGGTWDPLAWLSVGLQSSYLGSRSRAGSYGVFRVGMSVTLRL